MNDIAACHGFLFRLHLDISNANIICSRLAQLIPYVQHNFIRVDIDGLVVAPTKHVFTRESSIDVLGRLRNGLPVIIVFRSMFVPANSLDASDSL